MTAFVRPRHVDHPTLRLIVFHHAGGSAATYHPLAQQLPCEWEVLLHELPGRGGRRTARLHREMDRVVETAVADVAPYADGAYALFGHSMGAVVATETARRLTQTHGSPVWVGVSGRPAPPFEGHIGQYLSELDDAELFATLLRLGGTPARLGEIPELKELFLRVARADLEAVDSYRPVPGRAPLTCPLTTFGAIADPSAPPDSLPDWAQETASRVRQCLFPGGHFYFLESGFARLAREIRTEANVALAQ